MISYLADITVEDVTPRVFSIFSIIPFIIASIVFLVAILAPIISIVVLKNKNKQNNQEKTQQNEINQDEITEFKQSQRGRVVCEYCGHPKSKNSERCSACGSTKFKVKE